MLDRERILQKGHIWKGGPMGFFSLNKLQWQLHEWKRIDWVAGSKIWFLIAGQARNNIPELRQDKAVGRHAVSEFCRLGAPVLHWEEGEKQTWLSQAEAGVGMQMESRPCGLEYWLIQGLHQESQSCELRDRLLCASCWKERPPFLHHTHDWHFAQQKEKQTQHSGTRKKHPTSCCFLQCPSSSLYWQSLTSFHCKGDRLKEPSSLPQIRYWNINFHLRGNTLITDWHMQWKHLRRPLNKLLYWAFQPASCCKSNQTTQYFYSLQINTKLTIFTFLFAPGLISQDILFLKSSVFFQTQYAFHVLMYSLNGK